MLATGPVASAICNRIGCRITTIIGAIIASIGCAISYYATSMKFLTFSVGVVMGTGFGLMYCPAIVIVTMYFERLRTLAMGVTVCGAVVGTFVFSKFISFLITRYDWQTVFIIHAELALLCVLCGMLYRPIEFEPIYDDEEEEMKEIKKNGKVDHHRSLELHRQETITKEDEDKASPHLTEDKKEPRMIKKMLDLSLFADPVFLLFAFSHFFTSIGFISKILRDLSTSDAEITQNALASFFGLIVFSLVGDRALPFKYGKDRARNRLWIYRWFLMINVIALVFVFLFSGIASPYDLYMVGKWLFPSFRFIFGFLIISYGFTSVILVDLIGIERFTNAFGLLLLVQGIANFVGRFICGKIYDITRRDDWVFIFCGICLLLGGIMLFNIPFMKKRRNEVRFKNSAEKHGERPLLH